MSRTAVSIFALVAATAAISLPGCSRSPTSPAIRPTLTVDDTTVVEGDNAVFMVRLSSEATYDVRVEVETQDGSATAPGDYTAVHETVTVPAGTTALSISIPVIEDGILEPQECFYIRLRRSQGAVIRDGTGVASIGERYPLRDSPENVLEKLTLSYIYMDLDAYLDCLAEDFIFYLNPKDVTPGSGLPEYWGKATEDTIVHNMFDEGTEIDDVDLTMTQYGSPEEIPGPPPLWQYKENIDLRVYVGEICFWANAGEIYFLGRDPDEQGPSGEELWEIVEWYDVDKFGGLETVEGASWGTIKALYR